MDDDRRMTTDRFFGGIDGRISLLRELLEYVDTEHPTREALIQWLLDHNQTDAESEDAVDRHLGFLGSLELLDFSGDTVSRGPMGTSPLPERRIYEALRQNVKGFDLILEALGEEPLPDSGIRETLVTEFDEAEMTTDGPAARHREWLEALGFVRRENGRNFLTEEGQAVLDEVRDRSANEQLPPGTGRAVTDFLLLLQEKAARAGVDIEVDSSDMFPIRVPDQPGIQGKVRRSVANKRSTGQIWQRFDSELDAITEEGKQVIAIQLDVETNDAFDPVKDHFFYLDTDMLQQETGANGDLTVTAPRIGLSEEPFAKNTDDWDRLVEEFQATSADRPQAQQPPTETDPITPSAPYYWVTHSETEFREGYVQAPVDDVPSHDLRKLEPGDLLINYFEKHIQGLSIVEEAPFTVQDSDGLHWRASIETYPLAEPVPLSDVLSYLTRPDVQLEDHYPVHQGGIHSRYLSNLSAAAGEFVLERTGAATQYPRVLAEYAPTPFAELLDGVSVSISLPDHLYYPDSDRERLEREINAALTSGKHLILTGPPGTGKSDIATQIAEMGADQSSAVDGSRFTTATSAWTTYDTIGGYEPSPSEAGTELTFAPRLFLSCFRDPETNQIRNEWLVIDELNRANIDESLGQLFSVLSKDSVQLPYERDEQVRLDWVDADTDDATRAAIQASRDRYPVTPAWRLIGTMNTKDKASLYDLSFAFMRRFAFVHVPAPELWLDGDRIDGRHLDPAAGPNYTTMWLRGESGSALTETIQDHHAALSVVWALINKYRAIGPAIIKDMLEHLHAHEGGDASMALTSAITTYILPQLNGVRREKQTAFFSALTEAHVVQTESGDTTIQLGIDETVLERQGRDRFDLTDLDITSAKE